MTVRGLKALLENIVDDLPVLVIKDDQYTELLEEDINIVTFDGGKFIGPTVVVIHPDYERQGESQD